MGYETKVKPALRDHRRRSFDGDGESRVIQNEMQLMWNIKQHEFETRKKDSVIAYHNHFGVRTMLISFFCELSYCLTNGAFRCSRQSHSPAWMILHPPLAWSLWIEPLRTCDQESCIRPANLEAQIAPLLSQSCSSENMPGLRNPLRKGKSISYGVVVGLPRHLQVGWDRATTCEAKKGAWVGVRVERRLIWFCICHVALGLVWRITEQSWVSIWWDANSVGLKRLK